MFGSMKSVVTRRPATRHMPRCLTEPLEQRTLMAAVSWDGGAGTTSWHDAENWSGDRIPTATDDVVIAASTGSSPIVHWHGVNAFRSLTSARPVHVTDGELHIGPGGWKHTGTLEIGGAALVGGGLSVAGQIDLTGSRTRLEGDFAVGAGTTLNVNNQLHIVGTLENHGTINHNGLFLINEGSQLINRAGGTINNVGDAQNGGTVVNEGTFNRIGSTADESSFAVLFKQAAGGKLNVNIGSIRFDAGGALAGTVDLKTGTQMTLYSAFTHDGTTYQGNGKLLFWAGNQTLAGTVRFNARDSEASGASVVRVPFGSDASIVGRLELLNLQSHVFDGELTVPADSTLIVDSGATLSGAGEVVVAGTLDWRHGTMGDGGGTTRIAAGGTLRLSDSRMQLQRNLVVEGAFNWEGGFLILETRDDPALARLIIARGAAFNITGGSAFGAGTIENHGVLTLNAGTDRSVNVGGEVALDNRGTVRAQTGMLTLTGEVAQFQGGSLSAGTWHVDNAGALKLGNGTDHVLGIGRFATVRLNGPSARFDQLAALNSMAGTLTLAAGKSLSVRPATGALTSTGTIDVGDGARLEVAGALTLAQHTSILRLRLAGPGRSGSIFARGKVTLRGTLDVEAAGYQPRRGHKATLLNSGGKVRGQFKRIELPAEARGVRHVAVFSSRKITFEARSR